MPGHRGDEPRRIPEDSFEAFYEPARKICLAVLRRLYLAQRPPSLSASEVDDLLTTIVDDVMAVMHANWHKHDPQKATRLTVLVFIAKRRYVTHLYRLRRHMARCASMPDNVPSSRNEVEEYVERESVRQSLLKLPAAQGQVLWQRYAQERPVKEIAEQMDRTVGAVQSLLQRARENLRQQGEFDDRNAL